MSAAELVAPRLAALAALLLGALLCRRVAAALPLGRELRSPASFARQEESGTAMLDFVLTFPFFVMIVLVVIQFALMVNARIVVSYAAYAAARSAIVWTEEGTGQAAERATRAAAIACTAISPSLPAGRADLRFSPLLLHAGDTPVLPGSERGRRLWRLGGKHLYAQLATGAAIAGAAADAEIGPRDPVTVTVTHQFHLAVPYAGGIFSRLWGGSLLGLQAIPIRDSYTLLNEGKVYTESKEEEKPCPPYGVRGILTFLRRLFS